MWAEEDPVKRGTFLAILCTTLISASVFAQSYPKPASTPNTPVKCVVATYPACIDHGLNTNGTPKDVPGWDLPIKGYVGRLIDSPLVAPTQQGFRPARGYWFRISGKRVYITTGSAVLAYDVNTLFSRLAGGEALVAGNTIGVAGTTRFGPIDYMLKWDQFFNAEGGSSWTTQIADGDQRLFEVDFDDRGYVYLGYSIFGWGVVRDSYVNSGSSMEEVFQGSAYDFTENVLSVKASDGRYYLILSKPDNATVWDVGTTGGISKPSAPVARHNSPFYSFAKSSDGTRIAVTAIDGVRIYNVDDLVNGRGPIRTFDSPSGAVQSVTTDGTNFFAFWTNYNNASGLFVITPQGNAQNNYQSAPYPLAFNMKPGAFRPRISYGNNIISIAGRDQELEWNVYLYKLQNLIPTEIRAKNGSRFRFFGQYYGGADGHAYTNTFTNDAQIVKNGNKTYLLVAAFGLADVFEIQGNDSLDVSIVSTGGTGNPNSKGLGGNGPFIADKIGLHTQTSTGQTPPINWNFGDNKVASTAAGITDTTHQYDSGGTFVVNATSATDSQLTNTVGLTVKNPQIGIGMVGRSDLLFTAPNASSPAPIVTSDRFTDGSDGTLDSHYTDWLFSGEPALHSQSLPGATVSVGPCGAHTLVFAPHYGAYSATLPAPSAVSTTAISGFTYAARPFAATIVGPSAGATTAKVRFTSAPRLTTITADLPSGSATAVKYAWSSSTGETLAGTATLGTVPVFDVNKPSSGSVSVNLTLETTTPLPGTCAPYFISVAITAGPFATPAGTLAKSGCTMQGAPCSFTVNSSANQTGWTYTWRVTPTVGATISGGTIALNSSQMAANTTYNVSVDVDNTIGVVTLTNSGSVTAPSCPLMTVSNVGVAYNGTNTFSQCYSGNTCQPNEPIQFNVTGFNYVFSCAPHTFTWNFGDTASSSNTATSNNPAPSANHTYASAGTYIVTLDINNGGQTLRTTGSVSVGSSIPTPPNPPPPPPPTPPTPPPSGCGQMSASNVYISHTGKTSGCSVGGNCAANEVIEFNPLQFGYSFACASHTFTWNFADPASGSSNVAVTNGASMVRHTFTTSGTYAVTMTVNNGSQSFVATQNVKVGTTNSCPSMTLLSVYVGYTGLGSACSVGGNCTANEDIKFLPQQNGYNFSCANHTFTWNFGDDGSTSNTFVASSATADVRHKYTKNGTYTVTLTVNNGVQTNFVTTEKVKISGGSSGFGQPACSPTDLCLNTNGRYKVTVSARNGTGPAAPGVAVAQRGPFGFFAFPAFTGSAENPEVFVKVLEPSPGKPWVFYAGLTSLDYTIRVLDTQPGGNFDQSYHVLQAASGSFKSQGNYDVGGATSSKCDDVTSVTTRIASPGACANDASTLCLLNRFKVSVFAEDNPSRSTKSAIGTAEAVNTVFGFFTVPGISNDTTNIEMFVKMVDGHAVNNHFWVFFGGLTDMKMTLTVTDTQTGDQKIYFKKEGSTCGWNDVDAFK